jgi:hypothetical protein
MWHDRVGRLLTGVGAVVGIAGHPVPLALGEAFGAGYARTVSVARVTPDTGITTDTGDFAPSREYLRYTRPLACITAAVDARAFAQRRHATQIQVDAGFLRPDEDTLPAAVVAVARTCGARFTPGTTAPADLPDLFTLALWEANDTLAQTVLTALLAQAGTPKARGERLVWAVQQYLGMPSGELPQRSQNMPPAKVAAAEAVAQHVDALGDAAWALKLQAHAVLLAFGRAYSVWPLVARQGAHVIALTRNHLTQPGLDSLWTAYQALLEVAWLEQPDFVSGVAARLRAEFSRPEVQWALLNACQAPTGNSRLPCVTLEQYRESNASGAIAIPITDSTSLAMLTAAMVGDHRHAPRALPPLRADYWFPAPKGGVAGDSLHPAVPGRVTLIYHVSDGGGGSGRSCRQGCPPITNQLEALLARYPDQLAVTVVIDAAAGFTALEVPATSAAMAQSYQWLFQQYLKLPVAVAVRVKPVMAQLPPPDGRIRYAGETPYNDFYERGRWVALVTNRSGEAIYESTSLERNDGRVQLADVVKHEEALR